MNYPKAIIKPCNPEVKEDEVVIDECRLVNIQDGKNCINFSNGNWALERRMHGAFEGRGFVVNERWEWEFVRDPVDNALVLVPLKKETV